jgi:hypothetical protein
MGFYINSRKKLDGTVYWRVLKDEWTDGKRKAHHIPTDQLLQHGLSPLMSVEDAKERVKQLNALAKLDKKHDRAKSSALRDLKKKEGIKSAHLPAAYCEDFATNYLRLETDIGKHGPTKYKKALSHWGYVQRMIAALELPQDQWWMHRRRFYSYLAKQSTAPHYATKILRTLNMWGVYIAQKTHSSYVSVPFPLGSDREMIREAYADSDKRKKVSEPITPAMLEKAAPNLPIAQYRWLFVSIWFGLRSKEVDTLKATCKIDRSGDLPVLAVYQSKLSNLPRDQRYKYIPCVYPEQEKALEYIEQGLKRPLVKTVQ